MTINDKLIHAMIEYNQGDPKRIHHFLKVYEFASLIGRTEGLDADTQYILETAAIVHDIGIRNAEKKYNSSSGRYQEELGPEEADKLLRQLGYDNKVIDRVCYLVGHHHTYNDIKDLDYQILVEADFLVNLYEDQADRQAVFTAGEKIFRTVTGKKLLKTIYLEERI